VKKPKKTPNAQRSTSNFEFRFRSFFNLYRYDGGLWFRIGGRGLSIVNRWKHQPLFSERHGYVGVLRIGRWSIKWLRKEVAWRHAPIFKGLEARRP
jgi:hypothetical protein